MITNIHDPLKTLVLENYGFQKGQFVDVPAFNENNLHERVGAILSLLTRLPSNDHALD